MVELLVALFILALLAALLMPAVQSARESARRMQCQDHLRQWGVALTNFESQHGEFPPGYQTGQPRSSFVPFLLPFIEQQSIGYDPHVGWSELVNQRAATTNIQIVICPSTPQRNRFDATRGLPLAVGDYTSIHGVSGSYCDLAGWPPFQPPIHNGILTNESRLAADVTDGLSQTILLLEDAGRPYLWRMRTAAVGVARNGAWADPEYEIGLSGSDRLTEGSGAGGGTCVMNCTNDNEPYSFHASGIYVLLGDGGVRFVSEQVEPRIFAALITRRAGDRVNSSDL